VLLKEREHVGREHLGVLVTVVLRIIPTTTHTHTYTLTGE
jgi:hypothetical protein